jgi:hypothetical protein
MFHRRVPGGKKVSNASWEKAFAAKVTGSNKREGPMNTTKAIVWNEKLHRHIFYRTEFSEVL